KEGDKFKIYLNTLNLNTGNTSKVGDAFWNSKLEKWIYHYLYYNKTANEFFSVIFDSTTVELYSINYPPITETAKVYIEDTDTKENYYLILFSAIIGAIVLSLGFVYFKKRKTKLSQTPNKNNYGSEIFLPEKTKTKNSINLFGGFSICDKGGNEISQTLSPKLKEIFLLILIKSISNPQKGISSEELSIIIWRDASPESGKANRGVAINKIRKILSSVDGVDIEFSDKLWFVKINNESSCDYAEYLKFCNTTKLENSFKNDSISTIIKRLERGEFLKGISYEWLDSIKFSINNEVIGFLKHYLDNDEVQKDPEKLIKLCDIILSFDSVDQDAIKLKIKTLSSTGKHHIGKSTYGLFIAEYKRLYDENFPLTFQEIINS
ncbi:MAG: hypothetical protein ABI638_05885, partial [Ignavibacteriota bacterium]